MLFLPCSLFGIKSSVSHTWAQQSVLAPPQIQILGGWAPEPMARALCVTDPAQSEVRGSNKLQALPATRLDDPETQPSPDLRSSSATQPRWSSAGRAPCCPVPSLSLLVPGLCSHLAVHQQSDSLGSHTPLQGQESCSYMLSPCGVATAQPRKLQGRAPKLHPGHLQKYRVLGPLPRDSDPACLVSQKPTFVSRSRVPGSWR